MYMNRTVKFFCDFGPLAVFFVAYKISGIYVATVALIVATIITAVFEYYYQRKIAWLPILTVLIVTVMGGLTVVFQNEVFIKIKPTIINALFAFILGVGLWLNKLWAKQIVGQSIKMSDEAWRKFTIRWMLFFMAMACINELVWRNVSTASWVNFKIFGILGLTFVFMISQYPFLKRHIIEEPNK